MVHQHWVGENECFLVQPQHIGTQWLRENLIFRSSLWDKDGNPVSLSFKKFFNWDEKPDLDAPPSNLNGAQLMEKLDGSTLIFSRYKGHTVIRTRGTSNARSQENGWEIDLLIEKYKAFIEFLEAQETTNESYVFEWLSPTNRIVLNYGDEPDMALVAIIDHNDYAYCTQVALDKFAVDMHLRRPRTFNYNSIDEMKVGIEALRDQEGICVYYNNGQCIRKVKSAHYLYLHRAKSEISSIENVIDLWFSNGQLPYQEFFDYIVKTLDYELAVMAQGHISRICEGWKEVLQIEKSMKNKADSLRHLSRKDAAAVVLQAYGETNRASFVFQLLDNKQWNNDAYKKLLYQVLKK